ncbi:hypothetical protein CJ739_3302 [Mariniflexile rhizosphaerae]|uniref:SMP-30/gluconolactonase/LRE family protein n=1 Tax=unclassified Mariniflexile TaxID=2643887 RepID=UPI000CAC2714|nr:gluconolaconase [Mariniflexile sp. TRM1-10]AXP82364.1 hypothetical protein CJ739_3302 [Mariniflexile sp. TRM1-10]PLB20465.1 MAG: Periplasmic ATP/GTP-binding protein [Flavobacteriaceae bacterium FS1-H7996/R]
MKTYQLLLLFGIVVLISCKKNKKETIVQEPIKTEIVLTKLWETDTLLKTCEAVRYHKEKGVIYVSNIGNVPPSEKDGDGSMSIINLKGEIINQNWVTGMNAPKGIHFYNDKLYVTDIDAIVKIDIKSGAIDKRIAVENAIFLNDLDIDTSGDVYFTDSSDSKIYKLVNDEVSLWLDLEDMNPNGILVEKDRILVVSFSKGDFIAIDKTTKKPSVLATGIVKGDGIVPIKEGYLVSTWPGELFFVDKKHQGETANKILDTKEEKLNAADISIIPEENILLVPTFFGNKVVAYKIGNELI